MKIVKYLAIASAILLIFCVISGCSSLKSVKPGPGQHFYLAHNIWYERMNAVTSKNTGHFITLPVINYKTGKMIKAGTEVEDVKISNKFIKFLIPAINKTITFKINRKFQGNLDGDQLFKRTIITDKIDLITQRMESDEISSIKAGILTKGMSKEAVLVSFGYPPLHKTPTLDVDTWLYWRNKFGKIKVNFDKSGRVVESVIP